MNLLPGSQRRTSDGVVGTSGKPIRLFCVSLVSDSGGATTVSLLNGTTANGTQFGLASTSAASSGSVTNFAGGLRFPDGLFVDVGSNIGSATFVYTEEF